MEKIEKVQETPNNPEVFQNDIEYALSCFCEEYKIEDMTKESQNRWSAALAYIRHRVFPDKNIFKSKDKTLTGAMVSTCGKYDIDILDSIADIYIILCLNYDKEVSYIGFSLLTGIDVVTIKQWAVNGSRLSDKGFYLTQKIRMFREESLSAKLATANKNPVGILAILNRHYQWNLPGVSKETKKEIVGISETTKETLARLAQRPPEIIESDRNSIEASE